MVEPEYFLAENLLNSLSEGQKYLLVGIASSVSFLLLMSEYPKNAGGRLVTVPDVYPGVDIGTAGAFALVIAWFGGMFAAHALATTTTLARKLMIQPSLVLAVTEHPSILTNPFLGFGLILVPPACGYFGLLAPGSSALQFHSLLDTRLSRILLLAPYIILTGTFINFCLQKFEASSRLSDQQKRKEKHLE